MKNVYHRDIMEILLAEGGGGMRLCKLARKIYNLHADLFDNSIDYDEIHKSVGNYMWKQSNRRESPFVRNGYGIYSVRQDLAVQMDLFWDAVILHDEEEQEKEAAEKSNVVQLELF